MVKKKRPSTSSNLLSSKLKQDVRGDDVLVARDRLKGALEDLLQSEDESSSSQEEAPATPSKAVQVKKEVKPPIIRRRKRKALVDVEMAFHHTFVMKLYDRSVDLAQFKEHTPLYPICRAWIANQPRLPLPYPAPEDIDIKKEEEENGFEPDGEVMKDVYTLPPPSHLPFRSRIPSIPPIELQGINLDYNSVDSLPTAEKMLTDHVARWRWTRQQWIEAAQMNDSRYNNSAKILYNMIQKSQNAFS